ncbi:hypothetical protein F0562_034076 [Nyssa sinensis]|uniref:Serine-threonine/tyrosine-protein kinase catalytic domain-containing protein n=1 Tax=Nyssa sinensis TaxID=561372 RepID=A0A5J5ADN0_9ASTE|nr:hypothetical protein F0562_034076 [Nyssa sinensis]
MGLPAFFAFLLLFHLVLLLVLLHLAEAAGKMSELSCPLSFDCGKHGQISYPFANNTYTTCGLVTVNCDKEHPSIELGGKQYEVMGPLQGYTITLFDPELQRQIDSESCDYFYNSSLPHFLSNYFTILHNLTLFKCSIGHEFERETKDYFESRKCKNYTLYYNNTSHLAPIPSSLRHNCSVIQMPISRSYPNINPDDLFKVLAEFSLQLNVPNACNVCHDRGGRCNKNYDFWECVTATEEGPSQYQTDQRRGETKNFGLILGTGASATGLLIAIVLFCFFRRKYSSRKSMIFWKTKNGNHLDVEGFLKNCRYLATNRYNYSDVKKMTNSFKEKLGQGGYGGVYKGKLHNGCLVAVKVLSESKAGFIAPEVFCRNFGGVSHKSDVYSYGMMILEMVGGRKNIDVGVDHTSEIYFPHWIYKRLELNDEIELHDIRNEKDNENARKMTIVGLWCVQTDPSNRPAMSSVVDMLKGSLESLQIPPKPFLSSPPRPLPDSSTT